MIKVTAERYSEMIQEMKDAIGYDSRSTATQAEFDAKIDDFFASKGVVIVSESGGADSDEDDVQNRDEKANPKSLSGEEQTTSHGLANDNKENVDKMGNKSAEPVNNLNIENAVQTEHVESGSKEQEDEKQEDEEEEKQEDEEQESAVSDDSDLSEEHDEEDSNDLELQ